MTGIHRRGTSTLASPVTLSPTLVQRSHTWTVGHYLAVMIALSLLTFLLSVAALLFTRSGGGAAIWWPAAGVGAVLALLHRGPQWHVVILVGAAGLLSNLAVGRSLSVGAVAAVILAAELAVFLWALGPQRGPALLATQRGLWRFLAAVLLASGTVGFGGAAALGLFAGSAPVATLLTLLPSHASALLLITPLALVPLSTMRQSAQIAGRVEGCVQFAVTIGLALVIFSPLLTAPLLFSLFPLFAWAAARFRPIFVVVELLAVALIAPLVSLASGGPFAISQGVANPSVFFQLFILCASISTLFLAVARSERDTLTDERERRAAVMRGGFLGAQVGLLVLKRAKDGSLQTLESNPVARSLLDDGRLPEIVTAWPSTDTDDLNDEVTLQDGRTWRVFGSQVPSSGGEQILGIQLVDVSEHVAAREAMAQAVDRERAVADELRDLSRQKDDFVAAVSHELRTPITSILGFAEGLEDTVSEEDKQFTEVIIRNSKRLSGMVEQLLALASMSAANALRETTELSLNRVVEEAIEEQTPSARAADVALDSDLDPELPNVTGQADALGRIVSNLLSNAIKFTPRGGQVVITTVVEGDRALVFVDDSGVGISETDRSRVFERFYRADDPAKRQTPGTGLGLPIVRSLVEQMGGSVTIEDSPLGGTRMVTSLPRTDVHPADSMPAGEHEAPSALPSLE